MFDWLIAPLLVFLSGVSDLRNKVVNALTTLWSTLVSFFTEQAQAFGYLVKYGLALVDATVGFVNSLLRYFAVVTLHLIPRWAQYAIDRVVNWAVAFFTPLINALRAGLDQVFSWAIGAVNILTQGIRDLMTLLQRVAADIWTILAWTYHRVVALLTDPNALAQWLFAALFTVTLHWVEDNAVALGRWFLGRAVSLTIRGARILEDIIVSIF